MKNEIKKIKDETDTIKEEQHKYRWDTDVYSKRQKEIKPKYNSNLEKCKTQTMKLADQINHLTSENETLKKDLQTENELFEELEGIVYKMKNEIINQEKVCDKIRKELFAKTKKCEQLKMKAENIV